MTHSDHLVIIIKRIHNFSYFITINNGNHFTAMPKSKAERDSLELIDRSEESTFIYINSTRASYQYV